MTVLGIFCHSPGMKAVCIASPGSGIAQHELRLCWRRQYRNYNNAGLYRDWETDRKSTRLNSSHLKLSRMPSSA